jgi:preprotein translocase subunit SecA
VLGLRAYDVQLAGGLALLNGEIAEMQTGEGKTLVAAFPSYVKALEEKGVDVITVNEYLAKRDFENIGKVHSFLGLSVSLNISQMVSPQKQEAYSRDINTVQLANSASIICGTTWLKV